MRSGVWIVRVRVVRLSARRGVSEGRGREDAGVLRSEFGVGIGEKSLIDEGAEVQHVAGISIGNVAGEPSDRVGWIRKYFCESESQKREDAS